jgi:hypothetical protein
MWLSKLSPDQGLSDIHWHEPLQEVLTPLEVSFHRALMMKCSKVKLVQKCVYHGLTWLGPRHISMFMQQYLDITII